MSPKLHQIETANSNKIVKQQTSKSHDQRTKTKSKQHITSKSDRLVSKIQSSLGLNKFNFNN